MTITKHPTEETLAAYAAGHLDEGRSIVVQAHAERCAVCRTWIARLWTLGGVQLADLAPTAMSGQSFARVLARIDALGLRAESSAQRSGASSGISDVAALPLAAQDYPAGAWKWMAPGVHWRPLAGPGDHGARVFLLKAAPGTIMPHHTHTGTELTLVLSGAFAHAGGRYGPGDLDEADMSVEHQPVVESGEECVCLVAMEGKLHLLGLLGRVLQPFVRL